MIAADLLVSYPEFEPAGDDLIDAKIAEATLQFDTGEWGEKTEAGIGLLAAHLLAITPYGRMARLSSKEGESTYGVQLKSMKRQIPVGMAVI